MTIEWKDPHIKLHGKRHKRDRYFFRWHYGKQRMVYITKEYVDKPTENQKSAREAFAELRREVARQLRDEELRSAWMRRFEDDNEGYKMLHTYVYAKLKAGETVTQLPTCRDAIHRVSPNGTQFHHHHPCERCSLKGDAQKGVSTSYVGSELGKISIETRYMASLHAGESERRVTASSLLVVYDHTIIPIFLPNKVPKREKLRII